MGSVLDGCEGFEWDEGNSNKNWYRHRVTDSEAEQVFFNLPLFVRQDTKHGSTETRFQALGKTDRDRHLFVAFIVRKKLLRVISAREMTKSEERSYAEKAKRNT